MARTKNAMRAPLDISSRFGLLPPFDETVEWPESCSQSDVDERLHLHNRGPRRYVVAATNDSEGDGEEGKAVVATAEYFYISGLIERSGAAPILRGFCSGFSASGAFQIELERTAPRDTEPEFVLEPDDIPGQALTYFGGTYEHDERIEPMRIFYVEPNQTFKVAQTAFRTQEGDLLLDYDGGRDGSHSCLLRFEPDGEVVPFEASRELAEAKAELQKWRSGQLKFIPEVHDLESGELTTTIVEHDHSPPPTSTGEKRGRDEGESSLHRIVRIKEEKAEAEQEMEEQTHQFGVLAGQGCEFNAAKGTVFQTLKDRFPPGSDCPVPWRALGEVDFHELMKLGLPDEEAVMAASAWQAGMWLPQPNPEEDDTRVPPFIAAWAFVKHVTRDGSEVLGIREHDEIIKSPISMPSAYTGKPLSRTITKSAEFVRHLRKRYRTKADAILNYLLKQFKEYERHSGGVGFSGYAVIHKIWNVAEDREMTLGEMLELLMTLTGGSHVEGK